MYRRKCHLGKGVEVLCIGAIARGMMSRHMLAFLHNGASMNPCPFCNLDPSAIIVRGTSSVGFPDMYPVSPGHALVVPVRHVSSLFDLTEDESSDLLRVVAQLRKAVGLKRRPAGFNIAINDGIAAGQTVAHAHIHIIPRYTGDMKDPRGGVRWVIPTKARYWEDV